MGIFEFMKACFVFCFTTLLSPPWAGNQFILFETKHLYSPKLISHLKQALETRTQILIIVIAFTCHTSLGKSVHVVGDFLDVSIQLSNYTLCNYFC